MVRSAVTYRPLPATVEEAESRLRSEAPGYLERVRERAGWLAVAPTAAGRADQATRLVVDPPPPPAPSARVTIARLGAKSPAGGRAVRMLSGPVSRLPGAPAVRAQLRRPWRLIVRTRLRGAVVRVLPDLTGELAVRVSWMGRSLRDYVRALEGDVARLDAEVRDLRERVARLDRQDP